MMIFLHDARTGLRARPGLIGNFVETGMQKASTGHRNVFQRRAFIDSLISSRITKMLQHDAQIVRSMMNQPLGPLNDAQARVARLEAKLAQADFYIADALDSASDVEVMRSKLRAARMTLREASAGEACLAQFV